MTSDLQARLPLTPEQLTAEWLSSALAVNYPGTVVTTVQTQAILHGTASKVRLLLDYKDAGTQHGLPRAMCAKGGFRNDEQRALLADSYRQEAAFYRDLAPQLPAALERAQCYYTGVNDTQNQAIVLLEDLLARQVRFGKSSEPLSVDTTRKTLTWLATLHAHSWRDAGWQSLDRYPSVVEPVIKQLLQPEIWSASIARPLAEVVPSRLRDAQQMLRAFEAMWAHAGSSLQCGIHGDAHLGNMYFRPDGEPGFLDWQTQMRGPALDDVTYFMIGALNIDDRRRHERELLAHYLDQLAAQGAPAPQWDAAWLTYRQQVFHGLMWVATPPYMQPDEVCAPFVARYSAAVHDLESLRAVGLA